MARQGGVQPHVGERRVALLAAAVDYVLDHGITGLSLRPLAAALGTSDRMLIYYFTTRDDLVRAVLEEIAHRLRTVFADVLPPGRQPPATIVGSALSAGLHDPDVRRLLAVWLEVVALAARGDAVFSSTARVVVEDWVAWVGERIDVPDEQRRSAAAGVLVIVDGLVLFGAAGADEEGAAGAAWLLDALTSTGPA